MFIFNRNYKKLIFSFLISILLIPVQATVSQANLQNTEIEQSLITDESEEEIAAPEKVEVTPQSYDGDITKRLERIYQATGWFSSLEITTDEGIVFLNGVADSEPHRDWAERVAQKTSDVVAVVNRLNIKARPVWDIEPAMVQLRNLGRDSIKILPLLASRRPDHIYRLSFCTRSCTDHPLVDSQAI
ncbi:MAG: BON domain-containing protein [Planctomycetaceae bacterium]